MRIVLFWTSFIGKTARRIGAVVIKYIVAKNANFLVLGEVMLIMTLMRIARFVLCWFVA
jgi:hypothetical protein